MLNLKYKLYRHNKIKRLNSICITACFIWNHSLALQKRYYRLYGKYISMGKLKKHIAKLRRKNIYWQKLNSQSVQEIIERLDTAYMRFFKKLAKRPPKFRKLKNFNSIVFKQIGYKLEDNIITINKIGKYKFSKSRAYEKIKRIALKKDAVGNFYLVLCCDVEPKQYKREGNSSIGLDFGLKHYLTLSNSDKIESPLFYKQLHKKISKANKVLSHKTKASKNRTKAKVNLCKVYRSLDNLRLNHHWELAHSLCRKYALICIEDLNISAMKRLWGRKISDLSFSNFVNILEQCAKKYDTIIQKVDRFFPSSKMCTCGYKNDTLTLKDRQWTCPVCNQNNHRDILAANNILGEGIRLVLSKNKTGTIPAFALKKLESHIF